MWGGGMWPEAEPMGGGGMWPEGEPTISGGMWPEAEPMGGGMWPEAEPRDECGGCVATCMANFAEMGPEMEPHSHSSGPPECMRDCYFACTAHLADQSPPLDHATCGCGATANPALTALTALTLASFVYRAVAACDLSTCPENGLGPEDPGRPFIEVRVEPSHSWPLLSGSLKHSGL